MQSDKFLKIVLFFFGWLFRIVCFLQLSLLWVEVANFLMDKLGKYLGFFFAVFSNVFAPLVFIVWSWIEGNFPGKFLLLTWMSYIGFGFGSLFLNYRRKLSIDERP